MERRMDHKYVIRMLLTQHSNGHVTITTANQKKNSRTPTQRPPRISVLFLVLAPKTATIGLQRAVT